MNVGQMVVIVITIGQAVKELLRVKFKIEGKASVILMVVVSAGVVGYKFLTESMAFDLAMFLMLVAQVASAAIGGKLVAGSIAKKVSR
jgi:hypothetical protein